MTLTIADHMHSGKCQLWQVILHKLIHAPYLYNPISFAELLWL